MPLHLDPYGSAFVVFARKAGPHATLITKDGHQVESAGVTGDENSGFVLQNAEAGVYQVKLSDGRQLTAEVIAPKAQDIPASEWTITFQKDRGAPSGPQPLQGFQSWATSPDAGVRFFSGTATYRTSVERKRAAGERVFLTLTGLHEICTVRVNGRDAGTLWAMPYRLDITDSLIDGRNTLELDVTNLWPNRIIGDAQPSVTRTYTQTNIRSYKADSPLLPSGLTGPVSLEIEHPAVLHSMQSAAPGR